MWRAWFRGAGWGRGCGSSGEVARPEVWSKEGGNAKHRTNMPKKIPPKKTGEKPKGMRRRASINRTWERKCPGFDIFCFDMSWLAKTTLKPLGALMLKKWMTVPK